MDPKKVLIIEDNPDAKLVYQHGFRPHRGIHFQIVVDARRAKGWLIEHPDTALVVVSTSKADENQRATQETINIATLILHIHNQEKPVPLILVNAYEGICQMYQECARSEYTHVVDDGRKEKVPHLALKMLGLLPAKDPDLDRDDG